LMFLILHEAGHKGRLDTLSEKQHESIIERARRDTFRERPGILEYRRRPRESDADTAAILGFYNQLPEIEKSKIQTYDDLFSIIPSTLNVAGSFWGQSEKWKRYIIQRLMREGLVLNR